MGLLLLLGILGYWFYQVYKDVPAPPDLNVESTFAPSGGNPYRYHVEVYNKGGQTAENVMVEVTRLFYDMRSRRLLRRAK